MPSPAVPDGQDTLLSAAHRTAGRSGSRIDKWPIFSNCCPAALLTGLRGATGAPVPFSIAGTGCGDRSHAPAEFAIVGSVRSLMPWTVDFLADWSAVIAAGFKSERVAH